MIRFELKPHTVLADRQVIEVYEHSQLIATIVGADEHRGVRLISKFFNEGLRSEFLPEIGGALGITGFGMIQLGEPGAIEIYIRAPEVRDYKTSQVKAGG